MIEKDKVVMFHYTLSELDGEPLENTYDSEPVAYLHGHNNLMAALENEMTGKAQGDVFTVTIPPEQAYGHRKENSQMRVPIKHLLTKGKLRAGMAVKINTEQGAKDARIVKVGKFNVDVDTNHPLAGLHLSFDVKVVDVRDATAEEIAHGHAHGIGGHHH